MDNSNSAPIPVSNAPSISPIPDSPINKPAGTKSKKNLQIVGAVVLILLIIIVSILLATQLLGKKNNNSTDNNNDDVNTETGTNTDTDNDDNDEDDADADLPHRVYYLVEDDIYYYDVATNIEKKVYTFDSSSGLTDINNAQSTIFNSTYIDEDTLGFYLCDTITNNFNCKVYRLDAVSGDIDILETRGAKDFMLHAKFYGKNYFAYYYEDTSVGTDEARAVMAGSKITSGTSDFLIAEFETDEPTAYGRGGFDADDGEISYSLDGKYISFIRTSNILNGFDFNIRLYDATTNMPYAADPIIENATHPYWISNTKLAYKVFKNDTSPDNGKLIIHDIVSGTKTNVNIPADQVSIKSFTVLDNKFLYADDDHNIHIFDNNIGTSELVIDNAAGPLWIDKDHIIFYPIEDCTDCIDGVTNLAPVIYNLETKTYVKTIAGAFSFVTAYSD